MEEMIDLGTALHCSSYQLDVFCFFYLVLLLSELQSGNGLCQGSGTTNNVLDATGHKRRYPGLIVGQINAFGMEIAGCIIVAVKFSMLLDSDLSVKELNIKEGSSSGLHC
ncbi:hypothetical protein ACMD2_21323 [Ananas comosus]|uniref:Uncharacterized protein n=1 Tax=Ananas comosus TaxID=4615 RepID=A0A199UH49_ANACO|nr:hypothetical protein ACMD2_21323 [Ananas comosus]